MANLEDLHKLGASLQPSLDTASEQEDDASVYWGFSRRKPIHTSTSKSLNLCANCYDEKKHRYVYSIHHVSSVAFGGKMLISKTQIRDVNCNCFTARKP